MFAHFFITRPVFAMVISVLTVLAGVLAPEQPVYGLQAIGLDGLTRPLRSIPAMAARYCEEVRRVQPRGPYYLCGGSLGGTLAFEMAQQLSRSGEEVALFLVRGTVLRDDHVGSNPPADPGSPAETGQRQLFSGLASLASLNGPSSLLAASTNSLVTMRSIGRFALV